MTDASTPRPDAAPSTARWGAAMAAAARAGQPWPVLAAGAPLAAGYAAQAVHVGARLGTDTLRDSISGYKAALTHPDAQRGFGIDTPVAGVLLASGAHAGAVRLRADRYAGGFVETEIAFRAAVAITRPPADIAALRPLMRCVLPAIEIGRGACAGGVRPAATDLVAANAFNSGYITGGEVAVDDVDAGGITATLVREGELLHEGRGSDVLGDPWQALLWLVRHTLAQGWPIHANALFLTGSIGKVQPMKPGRHHAEWRGAGGARGLGSIDFVVA